MPADARWVDHANLDHVALIEAPGSIAPHALEALWWNTSIDREFLLGSGTTTDSFGGAERLGIADDGRLTAAGKTVTQPLLVQTYGSRLALANAKLVRRGVTFSLFAPEGTPRATMLADGYYFDGWLARRGAITVWPDAGGRTAGSLHLSLSMPAGAHTMKVELTAPGFARTVTVRPGSPSNVVVRVATKGPWTLRYFAPNGGFASDDRRVSVLSTPPVFTRAGGTIVTCAPVVGTLS